MTVLWIYLETKRPRLMKKALQTWHATEFHDQKTSVESKEKSFSRQKGTHKKIFGDRGFIRIRDVGCTEGYRVQY